MLKEVLPARFKW